MLKCYPSLNEYSDGKYCAPTILVEDENGNTLPIILPEGMKIEVAKKLLDRFTKDIVENYKDLDTLKKIVYGG
jgi:hypothetical protein